MLWFYGGEGMSAGQVAYRLGSTTETVKSYLKRLRRKLRARVPRGDVSGAEVDSRRGLYLAALDECRHLPECLAERDRLLRQLLDSGAPELA